MVCKKPKPGVQDTARSAAEWFPGTDEVDQEKRMAKRATKTKPAKRFPKPKAERKARAAKAAPIATPPKRRGRPAKEVPDYHHVKCSADTRAYDFHVPVKFASSVSSRGRGPVGTRNIGITIARGSIDAREAASLFVGTALSSLLQASPGSQADAVGQSVLGESMHIELCGVAQSGSLRESPRKFGATLCFGKDMAAADDLEKFCGMDGTLHCTPIKSKVADEIEEDAL